MGLSTLEAFKHISNDGDVIQLDGERLQQLHLVLLDMLKDIDEICKREGIEYTLGGGNCLGALRHHGFIPWDDDLDINLKRSDYHCFVDALLNSFPQKYFIQLPGKTSDYELAFPRIRRRGTVLKSKEDIGGAECGVYVDIFLIENVPNNTVLRFLHGLVSMGVGFCYSCRRFWKHRKEYLSLVEGDAKTSRAFKLKAAIGFIFTFLTVERWCGLWDAWNGCVHNEQSRYISIPLGRRHYFGELYIRNKYFPASFGEFEGLKVPLPRDTDGYMKALYGPDYMTPPPTDKQERHIALEFDLGDAVSTDSFDKDTMQLAD